MQIATKLNMNRALISILNVSLRMQGINNVRVVGLSKDFQTAKTRHDSGVMGAVPASILLPDEAQADPQTV